MADTTPVRPPAAPMHPLFEGARPANATVVWVDKDVEGVNCMEVYSIVGAEDRRHAAVDPRDPGVLHVFYDGLLRNMASWGKYPREFVAGVDYVGRHVVLNVRTGEARECVYDEFVKQKHHNFMYQHRVKRFRFPLAPEVVGHPDNQTYVAPALWEEVKRLEGSSEGVLSEEKDCLLKDRVHRFDKQRTVNNTFTYIDKHVHHGLVFLQKYKSYGTAMLPSVYVPRKKELDVGAKLGLLFERHRHTQLRSVALVNDHWAGGTLVALNLNLNQNHDSY